jgi:hypothetical protein
MVLGEGHLERPIRLSNDAYTKIDPLSDSSDASNWIQVNFYELKKYLCECCDDTEYN